MIESAFLRRRSEFPGNPGKRDSQQSAGRFKDEIESCEPAFVDALQAHEQIVPIAPVAPVFLLPVRKIQLGGKQTRIAALNLDVNMFRSPGVFPRANRREFEAASGIRELVASVAKSLVVVSS